MKQLSSRLLATILAAIISITFGGIMTPAHAQTFFGSIVGSVSDPSGAIVPGAKVTLTNVGTNEKHEAVSDAAGNYRVVNLVPAAYRLEVDASGFKHVTRSSVEVRVGSESRIDVSMEVGTATETVEVTTQTPLLQTESGSNSDVVEGQRVQEMPLNGRNTMNLIALTPGVVAGAPQGASALNMGTHTSNGVWSDYAIAGGFTGASAMFIDAAPLNLMGNAIAFIPTQDAVQEFQIASSGVSPEFGRFSGGVVNMTTKSGTNQWHGSVYEYFRNKVLNANSFFSNRNNVPRGNWNQDQFGVTLANPIVKEKVFSFFSWEGFRLLLGVPAQTNVPTDAMRAGTFTHPIKDPLGTDGGNGQINRSGCVTNPQVGIWQIKPSCFDVTANNMVNVIKYWPEPLQASDPNANFRNTPTTGNNANQYTERVDFNLNDKQRLFARYSYWGQVDIPYNQLGNFTKNSYSHNRSTQGVLGDTYTINQTSILDVRLAFVRQFTDNQPATLGNDLTPLGGAWGTLQTQLNPKYMPGPHILGPGGFYPFFGMNVFSTDWLNDYALSASLTKLKGRHSLKFGSEIRLSDSNAPGFTLQGGGFFLFLPLPFQSGDNFANFLFGVPASGAAQKVSPVASYNWYQGYYAADTWQVNRKLTLNLGLRWELPGSVAERHDRTTVLLPTTNDPVTGVKGTLALTNSSMYPSRNVSDVKKSLVAPRIGFAYRMTNADVIRGGYGITYLPPDLAAGMQANSSPVNTSTTAFNNGPFGPIGTLSNPFPSGLINPVGRNLTSSWRQRLLGQTLSGPVPGQPYPWAQQWNLNIGHQFPGNVMAEVGYAGSKSKNLPTTFGLDELPKQYWNAAGAIQANRPYGANYLDVQNTAANIGESSYNAGMVKVEKRFSSGGVVSGNYTYSKSLADVESPSGGFGNGATATPNTGNVIGYGPQDYNNFRGGEYSLSSFDVRQRATVSYVLNLPFGKGQKYVQFNGVGGAIVSGWSVNGITSFQKGFPMAFTQSTNAMVGSSLGFGTLRPNVVSSCNPVLGGAAKDRLNKWFNTACYTKVGDYALGNEPRTDPKVRTPGVHNWDISLLKATKIHENINAQFRAEFFNMFNHPQFAAPQGTVDDPTNFGVIIAQANNPRLIQFSLRINF